MADGVVVFDDAPATTMLSEQSGRPLVILEDSSDVLVFDHVDTPLDLMTGEVDADFLIFDAGAPVTTVVQTPQDFLLVEAPAEPARVVLEGGEDPGLFVITPGGPPGTAGQQGEPGAPGPQGPSGIDGSGAYYQTFGFASPTQTWTLIHNQDSYAVNVEVVDTNGDSLEGHVRYVDPNTIQIDWYYPTAGEARLFR